MSPSSLIVVSAGWCILFARELVNGSATPSCCRYHSTRGMKNFFCLSSNSLSDSAVMNSAVSVGKYFMHVRMVVSESNWTWSIAVQAKLISGMFTG